MACGIFKLANHRTTKQLTARNESLPCSTVTQAADEVVVVIDDNKAANSAAIKMPAKSKQPLATRR